MTVGSRVPDSHDVRTEKGLSVTSVADVGLSQALPPELISTPEWHSVCNRWHNAMLEGPERVTEGLLLLLAPYLRAPALWKRAPTPLELPTGECGSLVVRNISALDKDGQAALLRWLETGRKHVISTTAHPLFPLTACGLFDEALYFRLNVMRVSIGSSDAAV